MNIDQLIKRRMPIALMKIKKETLQAKKPARERSVVRKKPH